MKLLKIFSLLFVFIGSCSQKETDRFTEIQSPASGNSSLPRLYTDDTNATFISWVEETGDLAQLKYARFDGTSWSNSKIIAEDSTWFLNWADYPSVIGYKGSPFAAHWLNKKSGGTYAYDVNISTFETEIWSPPFVPHLDETPTEHGFVSMVPMSDSTLLAVWLDGRETEGRDHHEYSDLEKAMTLRGAVIHKNGTTLEKYLIDDSVCDCCNTSLTKTDDGGYILAYRNRTGKEIRDIYFTKFKDGEWSKPISVHQDHWKITACPVNGPSIASEANLVAVSWFTGAHNNQSVKFSISEDFGKTFAEAITLDDNTPAGRVDIDIEGNTIYVSWLSSKNEKDFLILNAFSTSGELVKADSISGLSTKRQGGFPQLEVVDGKILVAYTELIEGKKQVKMLQKKL